MGGRKKPSRQPSASTRPHDHEGLSAVRKEGIDLLKRNASEANPSRQAQPGTLVPAGPPRYNRDTVARGGVTRLVWGWRLRRERVLQQLSTFHSEYRDVFGIVRIGVFGSVARGDGDRARDVDVVVELEHPDLLTLVAIKQELEALLHESVDIVRYREHMNAYLRRSIEREAIYV